VELVSKKIVFRADGNSRSGLGHLYRTFALIEMYREDFDCVLLTREDSAVEVIPESYTLKILPKEITTEQEAEWLGITYPSNQYSLILDGYQFNSHYQQQIKNKNYHLIVIDDLVQEKIYADCVVNHALGIKDSEYKTESYTKLALGPKYAILRPAFLNAAKQKRSINKTENVFVCFGGSDQLDLSLTSVKALLKFDEFASINVVLGAAYQNNELIELQKTDKRIHIYRNLSETELLQLMKTCDFAIVSSSNILYEVFSVKMIVLSGYYVENQKNIYNGCVENHLIFEGGDFRNYSSKDFESKISEVLAVNDFKKMIEAQSTLYDSRIKERFVDLLNTVTYRFASSQDMLLVYKWANDKLSRANSYFSEPIALETHKKWFEKKLKDEKSIIYLAEVNGKPAGMVRYDLHEENAVVGVLVDDDFRGKGLASVFLRETAHLYFKENKEYILAYIKEDNAPSIKSFEKANYKRLRNELVHGHKSWVYKLEAHDV
jgi:UDP-2,4-diacetamido-2,4,6-trideoxy-beta-L-altropyranose hydrolase